MLGLPTKLSKHPRAQACGMIFVAKPPPLQDTITCYKLHQQQTFAGFFAHLGVVSSILPEDSIPADMISHFKPGEA